MAWTRSVPLGSSGEVSSTGQPLARQSAAISSASVATTTWSSWGQARAASYTQASMGRPAISRRILRGRRVEARRAGMTPRVLIVVSGM